MEVIGKKSKEVLKYIPAKLYIEEHVTYSYACKPCEATSGKANIITTNGAQSILYKSMASNELVAHVVNMKYHMQCLYIGRKLILICLVQNLSNWIMSAADAITPVYDILKEELMKTHYIQADEINLPILNLKNSIR